MSAAAARAWLAEQLAGGPRDSAKLKAAATVVGVSMPALYRAAASLGVRREPVGGTQRKSWRLPGDAVRKQLCRLSTDIRKARTIEVMIANAQSCLVETTEAIIT